MARTPSKKPKRSFLNTMGAWKTKLAGIPLALWNKLPRSALFGLLLLLIVVPALVRGAGVEPDLAVEAVIAVFVMFEVGSCVRQYIKLKQAQIKLEMMTEHRLMKYEEYNGPIEGMTIFIDEYGG
jgi:hypothetical protein